MKINSLISDPIINNKQQTVRVIIPSYDLVNEKSAYYDKYFASIINLHRTEVTYYKLIANNLYEQIVQKITNQIEHLDIFRFFIFLYKRKE